MMNILHFDHNFFRVLIEPLNIITPYYSLYHSIYFILPKQFVLFEKLCHVSNKKLITSMHKVIIFFTLLCSSLNSCNCFLKILWTKGHYFFDRKKKQFSKWGNQFGTRGVAFLFEIFDLCTQNNLYIHENFKIFPLAPNHSLINPNTLTTPPNTILTSKLIFGLSTKLPIHNGTHTSIQPH